MNVPESHLIHENHPGEAASNRTVFLSSYGFVATKGRRLGSAGYSYDFVAQLFAPLFQRLAKLVKVDNPETELSGAVQDALRDHLDPVHVTFRAFQDAVLSPEARNIVVPAWEFPDIPNSGFDGNPQNDWVATANRCAMVLVGGRFTADALRAAGVKTPIHQVAVPTPEAYFDLPGWQPEQRHTLNCSAYVLPQAGAAPSSEGRTKSDSTISLANRFKAAVRAWGLRAYRRAIKPHLPGRLGLALTAALKAGLRTWRGMSLSYQRIQRPELYGVVYTSIFNPDDGRKNWHDMLTGFLHAMRDREDATLVLKLITGNSQSVDRVLAFYRRLDISHRCRVVIIPDFLSEADMLSLARASAYYLTTTRAEGNCLPLMNYLAAGRPGVSPAHTAIADYFDGEIGYVVQSHPEPCAWPQDSRLRCRSTWHRLVWPSLVDQIRASYETAKNDLVGYRRLAESASRRMRAHSHPEVVWRQLQTAMEALDTDTDTSPDSEGRRAIVPIGPALRRREALRVHRAEPVARAETVENNIFAFRPAGVAESLRVVVSLLNFRPGKIGGTETYLRRLVARLPQVGHPHQFVLLMDRQLAQQNPFPEIDRAVVDCDARQIMAMRALEAFGSYRARAVEKTLARLRPDVVLFPQQSIFPKHVEAPCALVVHDLYHLLLPQYLTPAQRLFRRRSYAWSMSRADRIIAISQFTKKPLLEHCGLSADRLDVVPTGWGPQSADSIEPAPTPVVGQYLYYPAITRPHKNHLALLESIAALKSWGRFNYQLVLSGIQTPYWKSLRRLIRQLNLDETVRHEGYVSYERVQALYRGAACVVFPSLFEGFGLPVMEAVEAGKKILVSRIEIFEELGVPDRFRIDFSDPEQLHQALQEPGAMVLLKRPWSWDESAAATLAVLESTAGRQRSRREIGRARAA